MAKIMLVEDEILVRELALEDLSDAGFEVSALGDGEKALETLRGDSSFDLLLTDIRMPGAIDGWQLADEARRLIPGIRVIYATGLGDADGDVRPEDGLLRKPYRTEELLAAVDEAGIEA